MFIIAQLLLPFVISARGSWAAAEESRTSPAGAEAHRQLLQHAQPGCEYTSLLPYSFVEGVDVAGYDLSRCWYYSGVEVQSLLSTGNVTCNQERSCLGFSITSGAPLFEYLRCFKFDVSTTTSINQTGPCLGLWVKNASAVPPPPPSPPACPFAGLVPSFTFAPSVDAPGDDGSMGPTNSIGDCVKFARYPLPELINSSAEACTQTPGCVGFSLFPVESDEWEFLRCLKNDTTTTYPFLADRPCQGLWLRDPERPQTTPAPVPSTAQEPDSHTPVGLIAGVAAGGAAGLAMLFLALLAWRRHHQSHHPAGIDLQTVSSGTPGPAFPVAKASVAPALGGPTQDPAHTGSNKSEATKAPSTSCHSITAGVTVPEAEAGQGSSGAPSPSSQAASSQAPSLPSAPLPKHQLRRPPPLVTPTSPERVGSTGSTAALFSSRLSSPGTSSTAARAIQQQEVLTRLRIPWSAIQLGKVLGEGGCGTVYRGFWLGNPVAIKMLNLQSRLHPVDEGELRREALVMCELYHPCIAQVFGLVDDGEHRALIMRLYKRGSLSSAIVRLSYQELDTRRRLKLALQVATGMAYLHERNLIHGDLKTSNLLLDDDMQHVLISDFGLSRFEGETLASNALTVSISPPEVLRDPSAPRTAPGDTYAFGVVLMELLRGRPPFQGLSAHQIRDIVTRGDRPEIPAHYPEAVAALIQDCWQQDPACRPSFVQVVERLLAVGGQQAVPPAEDDTGTLTIEWL